MSQRGMVRRYYGGGAGWIPVRHFFARTHRTVGSKVDALDFSKMSDTMYEAELIWGPSGKLNSRPWVNWVPRDARNHFMECNYCRYYRALEIVPQGKWHFEERYRGDAEPKGKRHLKRRYVIRIGELSERYSLLLPEKVAETAWRLAAAKRLMRERKRKAKINFISTFFYPFDTDGRCLRRGDMLLCTHCALTILVLKVDSGRIAMDETGRLAMRRVEIMQDSREFFSHLYNAIRTGDYEKTKQERLAEDYKIFFPP